MDARELAALIEASDRTDLTALLTAKEAAKKAMLDDPSAVNVAGFERAKKALEAFTRPAEEPAERVFRNRIEALNHLQAQGYKIKKSKLYEDAKTGFLRLRPDGAVAERDLERYVKRVGLEKPAAIADARASELQARKLALEVSKLEEEWREKKKKNDVQDGHYMPREQVYMEIAGRAVAFEAGLKHAVATRAADLLAAVEAVADRHQRPAAVRRWFRALLDEQLNEFANIKSFQAVILEAGEGPHEIGPEMA
jgi:hypothetical protein